MTRRSDKTALMAILVESAIDFVIDGCLADRID